MALDMNVMSIPFGLWSSSSRYHTLLRSAHCDFSICSYHFRCKIDKTIEVCITFVIISVYDYPNRVNVIANET